MKTAPTGYTGNKGAFGSYQNIINNFPPHKTFISGFGGSGAVEFAKKKAEIENIVCERSVDTINKFWNWAHGYRVVNSDFVSWYRSQKKLQGPVMIYLDPPYLLSSRATGKEYYNFEFTRNDHIELLTEMKDCRDHVAISHYKDPLYNKILKGWRCIEWQVMTHAGVKKEALYMNYDEPLQLHQYDYLGSNRTERQQIKRMKERFVMKLKRMPSVKRYAMIQALEGIIL